MRFALRPEKEMRRGCEAVKGKRKREREKSTEGNESQTRTVKPWVVLAAHGNDLMD